MNKKYFKLLELDPRDAFYPNENDLIDYSLLLGRTFEVYKDDGITPWIGFTGKLIGDVLFDGDDGRYVFCYAKVEEVSNPTLI